MHDGIRDGLNETLRLPMTRTLDAPRFRFRHAEHALRGLADFFFHLAEIERWVLHLFGEATPSAIVHA